MSGTIRRRGSRKVEASAVFQRLVRLVDIMSGSGEHAYRVTVSRGIEGLHDAARSWEGIKDFTQPMAENSSHARRIGPSRAHVVQWMPPRMGY